MVQTRMKWSHCIVIAPGKAHSKYPVYIEVGRGVQWVRLQMGCYSQKYTRHTCVRCICAVEGILNHRFARDRTAPVFSPFT